MDSETKRIGYNLRGAVLRYCARNRGITQQVIAAKAGVHPVTLSRILNGGGATPSTIEKIAKTVGANPNRILNQGKRKPKYTAKRLEEIIGNARLLRQYVGE